MLTIIGLSFLAVGLVCALVLMVCQAPVECLRYQQLADRRADIEELRAIHRAWARGW